MAATPMGLAAFLIRGMSHLLGGELREARLRTFTLKRKTMQLTD